jgi:HD-GYP domain-containing protein (c-di-GMP phosphodiesterase class II)
MSGLVVDMVRGHHEREDGSGYPGHLLGAQISVPAKMAAIVDCFDALTSVRPYARTHTPYEALQMLYDWGKQMLHGPLVEEFIQCLGIYPVGGLVELNSGEVGLVVAHNRVRRLKPRILLLLDHHKKAYRSPIMLDLLTAPKLPDEVPYAISRALEDGMYGINPQDYYL